MKYVIYLDFMNNNDEGKGKGKQELILLKSVYACVCVFILKEVSGKLMPKRHTK